MDFSLAANELHFTRVVVEELRDIVSELRLMTRAPTHRPSLNPQILSIVDLHRHHHLPELEVWSNVAVVGPIGGTLMRPESPVPIASSS